MIKINHTIKMMRKKLIFLTMIMIIALIVLCGCEKKEEVHNSDTDVLETESADTVEFSDDELLNQEVSQEDYDKLVLSINGGTFKIGDKYDDVKDSLGKEIKPSQTYSPCGGGNKITSHYYDGMVIDVTLDGIIYHAVISGYEYPNSEATLAGIKLGATTEEVKKTFDILPYTDDEYTVNYSFGKYAVSFGLDFEGDGNVNYISIDDFSISGV